MSFQIPTKSKKFIQPNKSDIFGNIFSSFNMDFDTSLGKVRVAPRLRINTDDTDDADLTDPIAFVRTKADTTDRWWALCGEVLFKTSGTDPSASFTQDALSNTPTDLTLIASDMVEFEGALIVSDTNDLNRLSSTWDNAWWDTTLAQDTFTSAIAHPLHVTEKTNVLLIGDGNLIHLVDKNSNVSASRLILPTEFEIIWIRSDQSGTWIGARNKVNREAEAFFWNESGENYSRHYKLKSDMTFAGLIKDGVPYTVNGEGQLLKYTGSSFDEVAVFPNFQQPNKRLNNGNTVRRNVVRNGMAVIENKIHINISSVINNTFSDLMENFPSGIWTFDEKQGLRHKYALSLYDGTENDYGTWIATVAGALQTTNATQGLFLVGGTIHSDASTAQQSIWFRDKDDSIVKRGHFVTSIFEASSAEDIFQDIIAFFKRFRSSSDRIIIKYREIKDPNYPIQGDGTWSDTDTFTTTTSLTNVSAGDEVMFLRGLGAGTTARISSLSFSSPNWTVNLAETITNASGTMQFLIDNWTECAIVSTQSIERQQFDLDVPGTWIQFKVELRSASGSAGAGDSPELEKIVVKTKPDEVI